jgi:hypothetical protein
VASPVTKKVPNIVKEQNVQQVRFATYIGRWWQLFKIDDITNRMQHSAEHRGSDLLIKSRPGPGHTAPLETQVAVLSGRAIWIQ